MSFTGYIGDGSEETDDRETPRDLFRALDARFGFTIDVAAAAHNAKLERFYTDAHDGLSHSWAGERVWCNPPYSEVGKWIAKGLLREATVAVFLLPANRTEQPWWQDLIEPNRRSGDLWVEFLRGRLKFIFPENDPRRGLNGHASFASVLVIILGSAATLPNNRQLRLIT